MTRRVLAPALLLAATRETAAQCVMCGRAAANSADPQQASATFATAILVLLIPAALLLTAAGLLLWRFRDDPGGGYRAMDAPEANTPASGRAQVLRLRRLRNS